MVVEDCMAMACIEEDMVVYMGILEYTGVECMVAALVVALGVQWVVVMGWAWVHMVSKIQIILLVLHLLHPAFGFPSSVW